MVLQFASWSEHSRFDVEVNELSTLESNPVALPVLFFYWSLYPVAAIVLSGGFIISILLPIVSFSNHRPRLESYRLSREQGSSLTSRIIASGQLQ